MRAISSTLQSFLLSKQPKISADLYTISLTTGQTLYFTTYSQSITWNGITYQSTGGMQIKRGTWSVKNTQEVPQLTFDMYSTGSDFTPLVGSILNFKQLAHDGLLDYAYIELDRIFMTSTGAPVGTVLLFGGRTSTIQINALGVQVTAKGDNVLMQQYMPKNTYQLGCIHMLYDAGCTLVQATYTLTQNIGASGITALFLPWSVAPSNPSLYVQGTLTILSGNGEGQVRSIIAANSTGISLVYPLYQLPAAGDSMAISRGCAKTMAACITFTSAPNSAPNGNIAHYRGFKYIPQVETAY